MSAAYDLKSICKDMGTTIDDVRTTFRSDVPVPETLNYFWALQDYTSRLLDVLSEDPQRPLFVDDLCPGLIRKVIDVLAFAPRTRAGSIPAIVESIRLTSKNLEEIEYLKQGWRARSASGCSG